MTPEQAAAAYVLQGQPQGQPQPQAAPAQPQLNSQQWAALQAIANTPPPQPTMLQMPMVPPGTQFATAPAAAPAPAAPPQAPPPAATPPAPATLTLPADEAARLYQAQRDFEQFKAQQAETARAAEQARLLAEAQKGQVQEAFTKAQEEHNKRMTALQDSVKRASVDATVAQSLAGVAFADDEARQQVLELLTRNIDASIDDAGVVTVRDRTTGRPALDVLREKLASPGFRRFLAPSHQGGTAGQTFQAAAPQGPTQPPPPPQNLGEILLQQAQQGTSPAFQPTVPFELGRYGTGQH